MYQLDLFNAVGTNMLQHVYLIIKSHQILVHGRLVGKMKVNGYRSGSGWF